MKKIGWLNKKTQGKKAWKKRFFEFDEKKLILIYKQNDKPNTPPLKIIQLKHYRLQQNADKDAGHKNSFRFQHVEKPKEDIFFYADDENEYSSWISALQIHVPAYNPVVSLKKGSGLLRPKPSKDFYSLQVG